MVKNLDKSIENPLVTVLLPVYNGEKFLKETIESVLKQSFRSFEFVIIDDGSTDASKQIIQSFDDHRIVFIENSQNIKLINTLNKGLEIAKGKYLARIDADDYMHSSRLEKQVHFLEANSDYVLVGSAVQLVRDDIVEEGDVIKYYSDHDDIVFSMSFYCPFIHPSIMLRMDTIKDQQLRFDLAYLHAEDYELWTRIVRFGKVYNLEENLTYYRVHSNQISNLYLDFQIKQMKKIQIKFLKERLQNLNDQEILSIFREDIIGDLIVFYEAIEKFSKNLSFQGRAKERYILKKIKNHMIEKKSFKIREWLKVIRNSLFWEIKFTFFQYLVFVFKTVKFK